MFESQNSTACLDLGSSLTKIAIVNKKQELEKTLVVENVLGFSVPNDQKQVAAFASYLEDIFTQHKLPRIGLRLAMPEKLTSTQIIDIPTLTDVELATSIQWQAQQYIPIPKEDLVLSYQVLFRPEKKDEAVTNMRVLLIGIHRQNRDHLLAACKIAGVEPSLLETETISTLRHLLQQTGESTQMVINFGASGLDLAIVKNNELNLSIAHQNGSEMITKSLMTAFNLPRDKAEEYKKAYGIDKRHFDGKIAKAIEPIAQMIISDIKNTVAFYNSKNNLSHITHIYFAGGGSMMPGFPELLAVNFNLEINPLGIFSNIGGNIPEKDHLLYPIAVGLAKKK